MIAYLTARQVLFIHARLISTTGGEYGIRDLGLLESAVARPQATFAGAELYPDLYQKAAALMESLLKNHPFVDGNKRVAITAASLFMLRNGYRLEVDPQELERFTFHVANEQTTLDEIIAWFQRYTRPTLLPVE